MKKLIYISSILIINIILLGSLFKLLHFPGAGIMITVGFVLFSLWILPAMLINNYKGADFKDKKWVYITAFIAVMIDFIGALFKIQHWPGASLFLLVGISIPFVIFLPVYIYHYNKDKNASSSNFLAVILLLIYIAVFSVFLALSVSKNVIDNLVFTGDNLKQSNTYLSNYLTNQLSKKVDATTYDEFEKRKIKIYQLIEDSRQTIVDVLYKDKSTDYNEIPLFEMKNKDDIHLSYYVMLYDNEDEMSRSEALKNAIIEYREYCKSLLVNDSKEVQLIDDLLNTTDTDPMLVNEDRNYTWEERTFRGIQVVSLYNTFTMIESNIELAELVVYNSLK